MINNLQSILTQSSLSTEAPIYVVYSKQEICVDGNSDFDKIIYIKSGDDYPELTYSEYEELEEEYRRATDYRSININSSGEQITYEIPKDPCSGEDFNPDDWEKRYIKLVDRFEQAFFIRENAENFIARNKYNLGASAYIFVESAYRNPEWQQIRELLIDKARIESQDTTTKLPLCQQDTHQPSKTESLFANSPLTAPAILARPLPYETTIQASK